MHYKYKAQGICARNIDIELDGNIIRDVHFDGGCDGNHNGISAIIKGMRAEDVIEKFSGIRCGFKNTSCPDQLARALKVALENREEN